MNVLIVEDDIDIAQSIGYGVEQVLKGAEITISGDGDNAKGKIITTSYDLCFFDINIPGANGLELVKSTKEKNKNTIAFVVSGQTSHNNINKSYDLGVADFIKKPFTIRELVYKLKHHCKTSKLLTLDNKIKYNMDDGKIFNFKNEEIVLPNIEYRLLSLFITNINKIVDVEEIINFVWKNNKVSETTVRKHIHKLKKLLFNTKCIKNIRGSGYIFKINS